MRIYYRKVRDRVNLFVAHKKQTDLKGKQYYVGTHIRWDNGYDDPASFHNTPFNIDWLDDTWERIL